MTIQYSHYDAEVSIYTQKEPQRLYSLQHTLLRGRLHTNPESSLQNSTKETPSTFISWPVHQREQSLQSQNIHNNPMLVASQTLDPEIPLYIIIYKN